VRNRIVGVKPQLGPPTRAEWIAGINARIQLNLFDSKAEQALLAELTEALA